MDPPISMTANIRPKVESARFPQVGDHFWYLLAVDFEVYTICPQHQRDLQSSTIEFSSPNGRSLTESQRCVILDYYFDMQRRVIEEMIAATPTINQSLNPGSNSQSSSSNNNSSSVSPLSTTPSTSHLASLFECPVCFDYVLPPILQCQNGHLVCCACREKLSCCPACRAPIGNIRNLAMEKVAQSVSFPCKYSSNGCLQLLNHSDKISHEETCEFRPYSCPCPGASCKWFGSLDLVMAHLTHSHKSITTLQGEDIVFLATDINLPGAVDWVMMQSCFGHHFMLVLEKQEKYDGYQQFFAIVQIIGSRKQAENFVYRLELNGNKRRLTWEATPRSIHEGVQSAIMSNDCLVFDTSVAKFFADNGNLGINVTINLA